MANLALLYSGFSEEAPAIRFIVALARALGVDAEYRFMAGVRAIVGADQWRDYQTVIGLEGFSNARPLLEDQFRVMFDERIRDSELVLAQIPEARALHPGPAIELLHTQETALATLGFTYDLVLASFDADPVISELLIRQTLVQGGGPIGLIAAPLHAKSFDESIIVVAWKPSVVARRAIQFALPILRIAKQVYVVSAGEYGESAQLPDARAIAGYLSTHGVRAERREVPPADKPVLELSRFYQEIGADLMVMGGYSHSRLQELFFGGFTQYFIETRTCNLYLVH